MQSWVIPALNDLNLLVFQVEHTWFKWMGRAFYLKGLMTDWGTAKLQICKMQQTAHSH